MFGRKQIFAPVETEAEVVLKGTRKCRESCQRAGLRRRSPMQQAWDGGIVHAIPKGMD